MHGPRFWERYFRVYDVLNLLPPYTVLLAAICDELQIKHGDLALDAGSGTGNLALKLKDAGADVLCLDYCRQALERHRSKDGQACVLLADLRARLPFRDEAFDKVGMNNTLYTLCPQEQRAALAELYRVLKPGGAIAMVNPTIGTRHVRIYVAGLVDNFRTQGLRATARKAASVIVPTIKILYYNARLKKDSHHHYFELEQQRQMLEEAGFAVVGNTRLVYAGQSVLNAARKPDRSPPAEQA